MPTNSKPKLQSPKWEALLPAETEGPGETKALGARLGEHLQPGDVVALYGELGAGKTHLVKGVASALDIAEADVTSPTFTILQEHTGGRLPIYHFDAYRIQSEDEFFELGYEEYFYGDGICLIEWPARIAPLLPDDTIRLKLSHLAPNRRRIEVVD